MEKTNPTEAPPGSDAVMSALKVETAVGGFTILLHDNRAPVTCRYFREVVRRGVLNGGEVFRITTDENDNLTAGRPIHVIQFGTRRGLDEARQTIRHETTGQTGLLHRRWTVSASRYAPGEVYASFFVCTRDEPGLDFGGGRRGDGQGYAAFGEVIDGENVLMMIYAKADSEALLASPVRIEKVTLCVTGSDSGSADHDR